MRCVKGKLIAGSPEFVRRLPERKFTEYVCNFVWHFGFFSTISVVKYSLQRKSLCLKLFLYKNKSRGRSM